MYQYFVYGFSPITESEYKNVLMPMCLHIVHFGFSSEKKIYKIITNKANASITKQCMFQHIDTTCDYAKFAKIQEEKRWLAGL